MQRVWGGLSTHRVEHNKSLHHDPLFCCPPPRVLDSHHGQVALTGPFWAALPPAEVLVLAGYRAQKESELSLAPGDVVRQVCKGPTRGWLRGELGAHCGFFPERLVQVRPGRGSTWRREGSQPSPAGAESPLPRALISRRSLRLCAARERRRDHAVRAAEVRAWRAGAVRGRRARAPLFCGPLLAPPAPLWAEPRCRWAACDSL